MGVCGGSCLCPSLPKNDNSFHFIHYICYIIKQVFIYITLLLFRTLFWLAFLTPFIWYTTITHFHHLKRQKYKKMCIFQWTNTCRYLIGIYNYKVRRKISLESKFKEECCSYSSVKDEATHHKKRQHPAFWRIGLYECVI